MAQQLLELIGNQVPLLSQVIRYLGAGAGNCHRQGAPRDRGPASPFGGATLPRQFGAAVFYGKLRARVTVHGR